MPVSAVEYEMMYVLLTNGAATGTTKTCRGDNQNGLEWNASVNAPDERREEYSPLASSMLRNDPNEPFQTPKDRTMDHHGPCDVLRVIMSFRSTILEFELFWKLEVELDGGALMRSA